MRDNIVCDRTDYIQGKPTSFTRMLHPRINCRTNYIWSMYKLHYDFTLRQPVFLDILEHITPPFEQSRCGSHRFILWITRTSLSQEAWWTHRLSPLVVPRTRASLLLSTTYPWYSGTLSWCASTYYGTLGFPLSSNNLDCCRRWKSNPTGYQIVHTISFSTTQPCH